MQGFVADVAEDEQRRELLDWVEDFGEGLHILVNNAGGNLTRAAVEYTEDEWRQIFEINLFSAFELSRYAHPLLTQARGLEHRERRQRVGHARTCAAARPTA